MISFLHNWQLPESSEFPSPLNESIREANRHYFLHTLSSVFLGACVLVLVSLALFDVISDTLAAGVTALLVLGNFYLATRYQRALTALQSQLGLLDE